MKKGTTVFVAVLLLLVCAGLTGCGKYTSHYSAVGFVHSNVSDAADMSFFQFEGTMVFRLKCGTGDRLHCSGTVETGSVAVMYDCGNGEQPLAAFASGEQLEHSQPLASAGTVWVIVETDGKCKNGSLAFSIET